MFTVYSKPACPACDQAKALILAKGLSYHEVVLDVGQRKVVGTEYISRDDLLTKFPGARTVPQIMFKDVHVGSINELQQRFEPLAA
jgi:glutaredoxin 3